MVGRAQTLKRERIRIAAELRAVIYARVSKPGEKSVADQEKVGRRDLTEQGYVVVEVFSDKLSASRYRRVQERPGFIRMQEFIRAGNADLLWTFAANRAHRDLDDYVPLRRLCIETNTPWRYGGRTYDLSKSADRRAANADALRAEEQSDDISDAVNRGIGEALEDGKPHGKLPRGYRIIRDERTGKAIRREPIPAQAEVLREARRRIMNHESLRSVAASLEPAWRKAGGQGSWDMRVLRSILINPTYAGRRTHYKKDMGEGTWEGIFTLEEHNELRRLLTDPARQRHRGSAPTHWLSCIAMCAVCEKRVSVKRPSKKGRALAATYRCDAGHVSRPLKLVDDYVEELLLQLLERPATATKLVAREEEGQASIDQDIALVEQLRADIKAYVAEAARTRMSATAVASYVEVLEEQIAEAQARVDAATRSINPTLAAIAGQGARAKWARYDVLQRREVVRAAMRVSLHPVGRGRGSADIGVTVDPLF
ncbi:recombinase family protein [Nocardia otitidiscaviarum]|uniref:recombinase family protein n=1 Tax=Nocardia otitidiscaviarum TaxID=1823 RepID=UPI0009DFDE71|nr:recombinase family protein [Nocardia otitidiscaviarum]